MRSSSRVFSGRWRGPSKVTGPRLLPCLPVRGTRDTTVEDVDTRRVSGFSSGATLLRGEGGDHSGVEPWRWWGCPRKRSSVGVGLCVQRKLKEGLLPSLVLVSLTGVVRTLLRTLDVVSSDPGRGGGWWYLSLDCNLLGTTKTVKYRKFVKQINVSK